jgi:dTDP-4-dehydrorhamnose reductase
MKILLTGGSGLLGQALQMLWLLRNFEKEGQILHAPSSKELDITKPIDSKENYKYIIHAAGYTDVPKAEIEREKCFLTNVYGTYNLAQAFPNAKFVYISSEYVKNPYQFLC